VYSGDYIDDGVELNKLFLQKRQKKQAAAPAPSPEGSPAPVVQKPAERPPKRPNTASAGTSKSEMLAQDAEKVRLQNEKLQLANDFMRKKLEKVVGESIPTELVKGVISQLGRTYPTEYRNLWEQTLTDIAKRYGMTLEDEAKYKGLGIEGINKASIRAVGEARRELKTLVQLFSEKKEVGEREL
jgi:hypothetical protein